MIQFEYDQPTAGCRISFVLRDNEMTVPIGEDFDTIRKVGEFGPGGRWSYQQNKQNIQMLKRILEHLEAHDGR